jgi:hypothetical protein
MDRNIISKYGTKNKYVEEKKQKFSKYKIDNTKKHKNEQSQVCKKKNGGQI